MHIMRGVLGRSHVILCDVRGWQSPIRTFKTVADIFRPIPPTFAQRKTLVVVDGEAMFLRAGWPSYSSVARAEELLRLARSQSRYEHLVRRTKQARRYADALDLLTP